MTPPARIAAAAGLLDRILAGEPAERALTTWARASRFAGSKDRAAVRDLVYDALRRRRSLAWTGGAETGRGLMLGLLRRSGTDPAALMTGEGHALGPPTPEEAGQDLAKAPRGVRLDLPDWLLPRLDAALGEAADAAALALTDRAPTFLRVNLARATREAAQRALAREGVETILHPHVETALQAVALKGNLADKAAHRDGLVELQDASSQAAVLRLPLRDGMRVLDLCAGGGGKSLAMAARARLALFAHDADPRRMADLPVRAARAGAVVTPVGDPATAAPYDLVLIDAPCSGSGTWRRAPDAKWRLAPARLAQLAATQDALLDQGATLVGPGGMLAFATCSILGEEGPERVASFRARHPGWDPADAWRAPPGPDGDGFFQTVLRRP